MPNETPSPSNHVLGIIAGSGRLPMQLIETCQAEGRDVFVLGFKDSPDNNDFSNVPHAFVRLGAIGEALEHLRNAGVDDIVMAGRISRPSLSALRPDRMGTKLLARMGGSFFSGDDTLLTSIIEFLEEEGFNILGSNDIMGGLLTPKGVLTQLSPDEQANDDIAYGMRALQVMGELDIGQAVIVEHGYMLGVEAAEGTDALIKRCGHLKREDQKAVLIKARKPGQEVRVDLPSIGIETIEAVHTAGLSGIAIEAEGSLIVDKESVIEKADALGLFIVGVAYE